MKVFWTAILPIFSVIATSGRRMPDYCTFEPEEGNCRAAIRAWFYNFSAKSCQMFYHGGCNDGNENRFETQESCNKTCRDPDYGNCALLMNEKNRCTRKHARRESGAWFNPNSRRCEWFSVFDCPKYRNSFRSKKECYRTCNEFASNPCLMPIDSAQGTCSSGSVSLRYGYNISSKRCVEFWHASCGGNRNSFLTPKECLKTCRPDSKCMKPLPKKNSWFGLRKSYSYDVENNQCIVRKTFWAPSTGPRHNRFSTRRQCEEHCIPAKVLILKSSN